jgi:hypothetical protein
MKPLGWELKVRSVMSERGVSYWEACSVLGKRGGAVSGLRRSSKAKAISTERRKQEAMGIR